MSENKINLPKEPNTSKPITVTYKTNILAYLPKYAIAGITVADSAINVVEKGHVSLESARHAKELMDFGDNYFIIQYWE